MRLINDGKNLSLFHVALGFQAVEISLFVSTFIAASLERRGYQELFVFYAFTALSIVRIDAFYLKEERYNWKHNDIWRCVVGSTCIIALCQGAQLAIGTLSWLGAVGHYVHPIVIVVIEELAKGLFTLLFYKNLYARIDTPRTDLDLLRHERIFKTGVKASSIGFAFYSLSMLPFVLGPLAESNYVVQAIADDYVLCAVLVGSINLISSDIICKNTYGREDSITSWSLLSICCGAIFFKVLFVSQLLIPTEWILILHPEGAFLGIFAAITLAFIYKLWLENFDGSGRPSPPSRVHTREQTRTVTPPLRETPVVPAESPIRNKKHLCTRCRTRTADAFNVPCSHMFFCMTCAEEFRQANGDICNSCRSPSTIHQFRANVEQDCVVCGDTFEPSDLFNFGSCGHQLCLSCAVQSVRISLGNAREEVKAEGLRCPMHGVGCTNHIDVHDIVRLQRESAAHVQHDNRPLDDDMIVPLSDIEVLRMSQHIQETSVCAATDDTMFCSRPGCGRLNYFERSTRTGPANRQQCEHCRGDLCTKCRCVWLQGHDCVAFATAAAAHAGEDPATTAFINATSKECPNCHMRITHYHGHGCHHIATGTGCVACRQHFCYVCLALHGTPGAYVRAPLTNCPHGSSFCQLEGLRENLQQSDVGYGVGNIWKDRRCGCVICPDCRPGTSCGPCPGNCAVCTGLVPPGGNAATR